MKIQLNGVIFTCDSFRVRLLGGPVVILKRTNRPKKRFRKSKIEIQKSLEIQKKNFVENQDLYRNKDDF